MTYKIKCIVTSEELGRSPKYLEQQAAKYGFSSVESFRSQYIGRTARRLLKEGRTVESIREEYKNEITTPVTEETLIRFRIKGSLIKAPVLRKAAKVSISA
jgi:hypothetical protein